jgi:hypothetical protein
LVEEDESATGSVNLWSGPGNGAGPFLSSLRGLVQARKLDQTGQTGQTWSDRSDPAARLPAADMPRRASCVLEQPQARLRTTMKRKKRTAEEWARSDALAARLAQRIAERKAAEAQAERRASS